VVDASSEASVSVNAEKTRVMFMPHHQPAGYSHEIDESNKPLTNVAKFKYLGITVTNQNVVNEEIKSRLNLWDNECCHSVQNLLFSCLLSKNVKI
jgi:hypothetical protein